MRPLQRDVEMFPSPLEADSDGLVAIGGDLSTARLLLAYRSGIFPWYGPRLPICWWSPDPRAVIELPELHVSSRLRRSLRQGRYQVTVDRDFAAVIAACADRPRGETWLTGEMMSAYTRLHRQGHAHSLEVWSTEAGPLAADIRRSVFGRNHGAGIPRGTLVGGVYGVAIGGLFAAESMFHRQTDMSKIALVYLVEILGRCGFLLLDIQILSKHTRTMGGREIPRTDYLRRLSQAIAQDRHFDAASLPAIRAALGAPPDL